MNVELLTKEDLKTFKTELLNDIKEIIKPGASQSKQWLKSNEVRKMLSKHLPGNKLQNFFCVSTCGRLLDILKLVA